MAPNHNAPSRRLGTLRPMEPDRQVVLPRSASLALAALFVPLLASWGLGTRGSFLDLLCAPAAALASLPAAGGGFGGVLVVLIAVAGLRNARAERVSIASGALAGLSLLAAASAGARPLPWLAALFFGLFFLRPRSRRPAPSWIAPATLRRWIPPALWLLAARIAPFGPGLLPPRVEDALALAVGSAPLFAELAALGAIGLLAGALWSGRPPDLRGALTGAALAVGLVLTFGNDQGFVSAAALGGLVGGWPPVSRRAGLLDRLLPLLLVCLLASLRLAVTERWRCGDLDDDPQVQLLRAGSDARGIALSPGNLPYVVVLADEGRSLLRMTVTGAIGAEQALDPPGGTLISPLRGGQPVVRVVSTGDDLLAEWWDVSRLQQTAQARLGAPCVPDGGLQWSDDGAVIVQCQGSGSWVLARDHPPSQMAGAGVTTTERLTVGGLALRRGPLAQARIVGPAGQAIARVRLGPWAASVHTAPGRFVVPRGPAGHVELRGLPTTIPTLYAPPTDPAARTRQMLGTVRDSVRVGVWPTGAAYVVPQEAIYVWSTLDPFVTLVDPEVTWHQTAVSVGAPPNQVVVDPGSGTLYGANRCGVFSLRIATTFPWE